MDKLKLRSVFIYRVFYVQKWMKKDSLEKFWTGVHPKDEERKDLEIGGCRRLQQERERGELTTWNRPTRRVENKNKIKTLGTEKYENIKTLYINKMFK